MGSALAAIKAFFCRQRSEYSPLQLDTALKTWLKTPIGGELQQLQLMDAEFLLSQTAGYRAMQLDIADLGDFLASAPQLHHFHIGEAPINRAVATIAEFSSLPLPSAVVDVVVLPHVLDYCNLPHDVLKEASRVVAPSGYLLILGFNPWGWVGLCRGLLGYYSSNPFWGCRCLSRTRVKDWLMLLGYQIEAINYGCFSPPLPSRRVVMKFRFLEKLARKIGLPFGGYYVILAKKQRLRPINTPNAWLAKAIKPVKLAPDLHRKQMGKKQ